MHKPGSRSLCRVVCLGAAVLWIAGASVGQVEEGGVEGEELLRDSASIAVQDIARLRGESSSTLRGIGLVTGLNGTGDSGEQLLIARPLVELYKNNGINVADLADLEEGRSAALVSLQVEVPPNARAGDRFDVLVSVTHSATDLTGGLLEIAPLLGSFKNDGVLAFARGRVEIEDPERPVSGVIRGGAQLRQDLPASSLGDSIELIVEPQFRSYTTTQVIASEINGIYATLDADVESVRVAVAVDDRSVEIRVPEQERGPGSRARFLSTVLTRSFSPQLLDLPAMVIANRKTGQIVVTGDVEFSPVTVGHDRLVVSTAGRPGGGGNGRYVEVATTARPSERARIRDLLENFRTLDVPIAEQIDILAEIHASGRLHAKFVVK